MFQTLIWSGGNAQPYSDEAAAAAVATNATGTAYFWVEVQFGAVLQLHHVPSEPGFYVSWIDKDRREQVAAFAPGGKRGAAKADDGGGNPLWVKRACVLPRELALRVVLHFGATEGDRLPELTWGPGLARPPAR